jgi:hypothetical protein
MTPAEVRSVLGSPRRVTKSGSYRVVWHYADRLTVEFAPFRTGSRAGKPRSVASVTSRSPKDAVRPGIHVGSRLAAVKRLKPMACDDYGSGDFLCVWSISTANDVRGPNVYFLFHDPRGRVVEISIDSEGGEGCDRP